MVLLDSNVLSELMRSQPNPQVLAWMDSQSRSRVHVSAVNQAEIRHGLAILPDGRRKRDLQSRSDAMFDLLKGRILPFDSGSTTYYASILQQRQKMGRPIHFQDAQIAAICLYHHLTLVTRNVRDFEGIDDLALYDPWSNPSRPSTPQ